MASEEQIDIGWEAKTVPLSEVRSETYKFVNAVIKYYSGDEGMFGSRIAFSAPGSTGNRQIYTVGVDGSELKGITGGSGIHLFPSWAPGGGIVFTELREHQTSIRVSNSDKVLSSRQGLNMNGVFSPNGSEVAATLSLDGDTDIYILDENGEILRQCTTSSGEDLSPTWSPDGSEIAFVSDRSGGPQVFVMNSDCSNQRRITFRGSYNTSPEWSPTGDTIVFTGRVDGRYDVFTVNPESNYIERLTQDQGSNMDPTWSPDGRYIAFVSTRGGRGSRLYVSTADGQIQTLISEDLSGVDTPAWQR
jgi:TolB protein